MNDDRTEEQKYAAWVNTVKLAHAKGWAHVDGWKFRAPSGRVHDLSAADLHQLDKIEAEQHFLAWPS